MISADALKKIEKFVGANKPIVAAYVFGSCATGRDRPGSDIDIALMIRGSIDALERVLMETKLSNLPCGMQIW